jgi:hypothetical protein
MRQKKPQKDTIRAMEKGRNGLGKWWWIVRDMGVF